MPNALPATIHPSLDELHAAISPLTNLPEDLCVESLLDGLDYPESLVRKVYERAHRFVEVMRAKPETGVDAFMHEYSLDKKEGVLIMCLAEALLRIPDSETADRLIQDKFREAQWKKYLGSSESLLVNASTWGLVLTGSVINLGRNVEDAPLSQFGRLVRRSGEPIIRQALLQAMRIIGQQFILGRTIKEALTNSAKMEKKGYLYSYDILGEAARTMAYAEEYRDAYVDAIEQMTPKAGKQSDMFSRPGISIKLSALHPRYELAKRDRVKTELMKNLKAILVKARDAGIIAAIDAEEARRLDISLEIFETLLRDPEFSGWDGIGLVVQAYQKRAVAVIDWLAELATATGRQIPVRLVKGAYWDTEIKEAQMGGHRAYPVFTRKENTDVSYLACAQKLLGRGKRFYPQFATHNAHTMAAIIEMAPKKAHFEFQRLHGMGEVLHNQVVEDKNLSIACRIYAPIGKHADLLAYLVRRLLENGANTSFINRLADKNAPIEDVITDPVKEVRAREQHANPKIPLPHGIYSHGRLNSFGVEMGSVSEVAELYHGLEGHLNQQWDGGAIIGGKLVKHKESAPSTNPADRDDVVGMVSECTDADIRDALERGHKAFPAWDEMPALGRSAVLRKAADLLEHRTHEAMMLCIREAGKTIEDAIAEVREAIDFCRYYAMQAERLFAEPIRMDTPTGESNHLQLQGRGVILCISPWNFPLAIFTGQVVAALAAGNAVLAKPAEQTSLVAAFMVRLLHEAGVPGDVLHLIPGEGSRIGKLLLPDDRIAGVAFTGSTETAKIINRTLAAREGAIVPLIAETGGQNAMVVDSSALPEQVTDDVLHSALYSAGQRCSALRVLFLQQDIADKVLDMIAGAMAELSVGNPYDLATDVGPVVDEEAQSILDAHIAHMKKEAKLVYACNVKEATARKGTFVAPHAFEISGIDVLKKEVFGPVLHVVRFKGDRLDDVIDAINGTGYGLTLGIHSRVEQTCQHIASRVRVGNTYVNRGMTGAVVGVQPFGGEGLSGTGPKAGGPHYMLRFATERTLTVNTAAIGGNIELFS